jgi:hypothetical protein
MERMAETNKARKIALRSLSHKNEWAVLHKIITASNSN